MAAAQILAACLFMAANTYHVPPAVLIGIMRVEGGRVGQEAGPDIDGSYDLGPMQVNAAWVPQLAHMWHVDDRTARSWVRDNGCVNVHAAGWILKQKISESGSLFGGIARYHSASRALGTAYAEHVLSVMKHRGLIDDAGAQRIRERYESLEVASDASLTR